jgi:Arc/MetJ-type ribon-helix-helix transcriptional regulator
MDPESEVIRAEIPDVEKIFRDECWLEAERRGAPVEPQDDVVRERVAEIILTGVGARLRQKYRR